MDKIKIEYFVKKDLVPIEIQYEVVNVLWETAPSETVVCKWAR